MPSSVINNTTEYPYRAAVSIYVRWSNGTTSRGSGTMIGRNDVLTAAHVVYNPSRGSAVHISVIPGQNGANAPYGISDAGTWNYYQISRTSNGNLTRSTASHDLAVIGLRQNTGDTTGTFGYRSNVSSSITRNLIHYPSASAVGFQDLRQILSTATVGSSSTNINPFSSNRVLDISDLGTSNGSSGGGIYQLTGGNRYVTGVVSTGSWGAYINSDRYNQITNWANGNNNVVTPSVTQLYNLGTASTTRTASGIVHQATNRTDRYAFNVSSTRSISATLSGMNTDADLYLYDVYGRVLGSSSNGGNQTDRVTSSLTPGIYYAEVRQHTNTAAANPYRLSVGPTFSIPIGPIVNPTRPPIFTRVAGASGASLLAAA